VKPPATQPWFAVVVALIFATSVALAARSFGPHDSTFGETPVLSEHVASLLASSA
jgi:hypothetical protein